MTSPSRLASETANAYILAPSSEDVAAQQRVKAPCWAGTSSLDSLEEGLKRALYEYEDIDTNNDCHHPAKDDLKQQKLASSDSFKNARSDNAHHPLHLSAERKRSLDALFANQPNFLDSDDEDISVDAHTNKLASLLDNPNQTKAKFSLGSSCPELFKSRPEGYELRDAVSQHCLAQNRATADEHVVPVKAPRSHKYPRSGNAVTGGGGRLRYQRRNSFVIAHTSREGRRPGLFPGLATCTDRTLMPPPPSHVRHVSEGACVFGLSRKESQLVLRRFGQSLLQPDDEQRDSNASSSCSESSLP